MDILVVEDHSVQFHLVRAVLIAGGHTVRHAASGVAALKSVRESPPDLLLLDACLPGISGFEVARDLRGDPRTARIPIVMMSAAADAGDREQALASGCDGFFAKPIDTRTFAADLARLLGRRPPPGSP